jgi:tetratricopeptide (TPR) repeat protein
MKKAIVICILMKVASLSLHAAPVDSLLQFIHTSRSAEKIATALNQLGIIYSLSGEYDVAVKYYIGSAKVCEITKDSVKLGRRYSNIGGVYSALEDFDKAMQYWRQAAFVAGRAKDSNSVAKNWVNMAGYYERKQIMDSAFYYTQQADGYFRRNHDTLFYLVCETSLANYANLQGNQPKAIDMLKLSIAGLEQLQNKTVYFEYTMVIFDALQSAYNRLADIYIQLGRYDDAYLYLNKALRIDAAFPNQRESIYTYQYLYKVSRYKKKYQQALHYYEKSIALEDSAKGDKNIKIIRELTAKYENEKIEKENIQLKYEVDIEKEKDKVNQIRLQRLSLALIFVGTGIVLLLVFMALLLNRNKIRSQYLKLLSRENKILEIDNHKLEIKRLLAQINPHLIFNSLTSLQNYILLKRSDESLIYLEKLSRYMRNIFVVSEKEQVELSFEIQLLKDYIYLESLRFEEEVAVDITMDKEIKADELLIPPLVFQPFVENAFKHGFTKENSTKKLKIQFRIIDHQLMECTIADNGGASAPDVVDKLQTAINRPMGGIKTTVQRLMELNLQPNTAVFSAYKIFDSASNEYFTHIKLLVPYSRK